MRLLPATFDRYLLGRFVSIYGVLYVAMLGLFAVVDGFTNLDAFQQAAGDRGSVAMLQVMAIHYACQAFAVFNMLGQTLGIVAAMAVLALGLKFGEIHPLLAAGVKGHRVILPLAIGLVGVNLLMAANRELILPQLASHLSGSHGDTAKESLGVDPAFDQRGIFISAAGLAPKDSTLRRPEFRLTPGLLTNDHAVLRAEAARWFPGDGAQPSGWGLIGLTPPVSELDLTDLGREVVRTVDDDPTKAFVESTLSFGQLRDRSRSYQFLTTPDLMRRIRQTPRREASSMAQVMHLHGRLAGPLLNVIGVFIVAPLVVRKDKWSIVTNMATASLVVGLVFGGSQAAALAGSAGLVSPEIAVWGPIAASGGLATWLAAEMRT